MNKDAKITVKTAAGESREADTGENIGQGTVEGAVISAASIDYTIDKFFANSAAELSYGNLKIQPIIFQDDIARLTTNVKDAQTGNIKLANCLETKLLNFNVEKCGYIVLGSKQAKKKIEKELANSPLTLNGKVVKSISSGKYLGDYICDKGLPESVHKTVLKRKGQAIACIMEVRAILNDCRSGVIGGITSGLEIWELGIVPFLLYNCDTWVEMKKSTLKELDEIQYLFYRALLSTPRTCPIPILLWDTGGIMMEHRIAMKKLLFYHHIKHLEKRSLASMIADIQEKLSFPGLMQECVNLMSKYNIKENVCLLSKLAWKKVVKKYIMRQNELDLTERIRYYKKLDQIDTKNEVFGRQPYMKTLNLPDARLRFALRARMTRTIQTNFKGDPGFKANGWKCVSCGTLDTQEHVMVCDGYKAIRKEKTLKEDKGIVEFFREVIRLRS